MSSNTLIDSVSESALPRILLVISDAVLVEDQRVLNYPRLRLPTFEIEALLRSLTRLARRVSPVQQLSPSPDESDNRFLECAESGEADYPITGNTKHFPARFGRTRVIKPHDFLLFVGSGG